MQRGISSKVSELRITASFQKCLSNSWLVGDHSQVKRSLQTEEETERGDEPRGKATVLSFLNPRHLLVVESVPP